MSQREKCTWEIERPDGEATPCGRTAFVEFRLQETSMGRPLIRRYPRCKRHATTRTIDWAKVNDYDIHYLDSPTEG